MASSRIVNLTELADLLDMSRPTLRDLIKDNADFPVEVRGDHGVPYEFDIDLVQVWWRDHQEAIAAAEAARRDQLELLADEIYGANKGTAEQSLTPSERKTLAEAVRAEDYNRIRRGDLLEKDEVAAQLSVVLSHLQKGLRLVPQDFARETGIDRSLRLLLENMLRQRVNALYAELTGLLGETDGERASA